MSETSARCVGCGKGIGNRAYVMDDDGVTGCPACFTEDGSGECWNPPATAIRTQPMTDPTISQDAREPVAWLYEGIHDADGNATHSARRWVARVSLHKPDDGVHWIRNVRPLFEAHLRTPAPMLMTQEWLDKKVDADPVAEVEACTPASGEAGEMVERMTQRFLQWKLPEGFSPDAGISFNPEFNAEWNAKHGNLPQRHEPVGTNLFSHEQAKAMVQHMIEGTRLSATDTEAMRLLLRDCRDAAEHARHFTGGSKQQRFADLLARIDALAKGGV